MILRYFNPSSRKSRIFITATAATKGTLSARCLRSNLKGAYPCLIQHFSAYYLTFFRHKPNGLGNKSLVEIVVLALDFLHHLQPKKHKTRQTTDETFVGFPLTLRPGRGCVWSGPRNSFRLRLQSNSRRNLLHSNTHIRFQQPDVRTIYCPKIAKLLLMSWRKVRWGKNTLASWNWKSHWRTGFAAVQDMGCD